MFWSGTAAADGVSIASGGPKSAGDRALLVSAIGSISGELGVCFRGKRPRTVRIELNISASGEVARARQKSKGAVAQCVAGVLAIQTLRVRGAYSVTVDVPTSRGAASSELVDVDADLKTHAKALNGCYKKAAKKRKNLKGRVVLRFLIKPDGSIIEPEIQSSTLSSPAVENCLVSELGSIKVSERPGGKTLAMSFALQFDGRSGSGAQMASGDTSNQPQKRGPLEGKVITRVMTSHKNEFSACYDKVVRKNPSLAGRVVLRFTIRGDGSVRNVKVRETSLNHAGVENCIVRVGKKLRFPGESGRDVTKVWYPFVFSLKKMQ